MTPNGHATAVLLADDHQMLRDGLRRLLSDEPDIHVVGEAGDSHEVLELLRRERVDVVVCELSMPGLPATELIKRIRSEHPKVGVLVLSRYPEEPYAARVFRCGAHGFMTKDSAAERLVQAIRKVASGGMFVSGPLAERLALNLSHSTLGPRHELLSDREFEVLRHLVSGRRMSEIARLMHLSIKTVSTHKGRILEKLNLSSVADLVRYTIDQGLFERAPALKDKPYEVVRSGSQMLLPL